MARCEVLFSTPGAISRCRGVREEACVGSGCRVPAVPLSRPECRRAVGVYLRPCTASGGDGEVPEQGLPPDVAAGVSDRWRPREPAHHQVALQGEGVAPASGGDSSPRAEGTGLRVSL
jgi:hypothetical protein